MKTKPGMALLDRADDRRPVVVVGPRARRARPRCARRRRSSSASPCRSGRRRTGRRWSRSCRSRRRAGRARTRSAARRRARRRRTGPCRSRSHGRRRGRTTPGRARGRRRCRRRSTRGAPPSTDGRARRGSGTKSRMRPTPRSASALRADARPFAPAEVLGDDVVADAVGRADDVGGACSRAARARKSSSRPGFCSAIAIPAGLRSQTPMSQTASKPSAAIASHSAAGTPASPIFLPSRARSSSSQTQVLIS